MEDKEIREILLKERNLITNRVEKLNKSMFNYIKIVVSPFILLVGYLFVGQNEFIKYTIVLVPYFTIFSALLLGVLFIQIMSSEVYVMYLTDKINKNIGRKVLISDYIDREFVGRGVTMATVFTFTSSIFVLLFNILLLEYISKLVSDLGDVINKHLFVDFEFLYWSILIILTSVFCYTFYNQFIVKYRRISRMAGIRETYIE